MNVFALDKDPVTAARMMCDKHVVAMCRETSQLLTTCLHHYGFEAPITRSFDGAIRRLKPTHHNHCCNVWLRSSRANFEWLLTHFRELLSEKERRFGTKHQYDLEDHASHYAIALERIQFPSAALTPFAQAMPEQYRGEDTIEGAVAAYRRYYIGEKSRFAAWRFGAPDWWPDVILSDGTLVYHKTMSDARPNNQQVPKAPEDYRTGATEFIEVTF